jgi:hypothetical protein
MEPIEWIVVALVVIIIGIALFAGRIRDWLFGGTGTRPNTRLAVGQSPARGPAPPAGTTFVAKLTDDNGNPLPIYDVTFTVLPGADGNVTPVIDGDATVTTDQDGLARVVVKGTDDGADSLKVAVGLSETSIDYETLKNDP